MPRSLLAIALSLLMIFSMPGCRKASENPSQPDEIENYFKELEEVTIVVPLPGSQVKDIEHAEERLRSKGINLHFLVYPKKSGYFNYDDYISFCEKVCREHQNVVMIFKSDAEISGYLLEKSPGLVRDIKTDFEKNAPFYYSKYQLNNSDKIYDITLGIRDNSIPGQLAILVKNEYAEKYGKPIETAEDYAGFLQWASAFNEQDGVIPGYMPVGIYEKSYYNSYVPFDLFAQQYGYITASTVLPMDVGGIYTDLFPKENQGFYPLENIPEFRTAMLELCTWAKNGWMEFGFAMNIPDDMSKYASIVVNTLDYVTRDAEFFFANGNITVDAGNYTMFMLYPDRTPNPWNNIIEYNYCAVVSANTKNPESFFRFLDWLIESQQNYDYFHYGILNTDNSFDGEKTDSIKGEKTESPENGDNNTLTGNKEFDCFTIPSFRRISSFAPSNWNDIRKISSKLSIPLLEAFSKNYKTALSLNTRYIQRKDLEKISRRENDYIDFFYSLLSSPQDDAPEKIDAFILKQKGAGDGTYLAECFYQMFKELSAS